MLLLYLLLPLLGISARSKQQRLRWAGPASRRTSFTADVLALRHPLQWDGGDGATMAKKDTASNRLIRPKTPEDYQPFVLEDKNFRPNAVPKSALPLLGCPVNDEGTQRILGQVGGRFVPHGLELEALRDDLNRCYLDWCSLSQLTSDKIARQRVQRLETIARHADAVLALLDERGVIGDWARQEIAMTFPLKEGAPVRKTAAFRTDHGQPDAAPSFNGFVAGLQRLAAAVRYKAEYFPDRALYQLPRSPLDFFVANALPRVFERHFERAAGFSRASDGAQGPYIRFAVAALKELGITNKGRPYARDTIARALSSVRAGRVRRRKID